MTTTNIEGGNDPSKSEGGGNSPEPMIPQSKVNQMLAEHKRNLQREAAQAKEAHEALRQQVEGLLNGKSLDEAREEMEATAAKLRSAEEQRKLDEAKYAKELKSAREIATSSHQKYRNLAIGRALSDAAHPLASTPAAANLIAKELFDKSDVDDNGVVTVELEVEEEGQRVKKKLSPSQAVAILESRPSEWGPLFKSTVKGGTSDGTEGILRKNNGKLDVSSMDMKQYAELRKKNPDYLSELT